MTIWPEMPDCGAYLVWPSDGTDWIHPEDVKLASSWIPSTRVFRRDSFDGTYYRLHYGPQFLRVKPTMWHRVPDEGLSVGEMVEVLSNFQENDPCIATIREIRFDKPNNRVLYSLDSREMPLPRPFSATDLASLTPRTMLRPSDENQAMDTNPT